MERPAVKKLMASMSRTWIGIRKETGLAARIIVYFCLALGVMYRTRW
jgi:hypothetical protein